jgi:hypothetical protein
MGIAGKEAQFDQMKTHIGLNELSSAADASGNRNELNSRPLMAVLRMLIIL